jgi:hypothetical protein
MRETKRVVVLAIWAALLLAPMRLHAQPSNDDCSTPTVVTSLPYASSEDTSSATTAHSDPILCFSITQDLASVWYSFTPSTSGTIQIDTSGSNYKTDVSVWTGSCGSLTQVYCDAFGAASRTLDVTAATTYLIEVTAYEYNHVNGGALTLSLSAVPTPSNDSCAAAVTIGALPYSDTTDTRGATTDGSDPVQSCTGSQGTKSVWYKYAAPSDGVITVNGNFAASIRSPSSTVVAYTGTCGDLTEVRVAGGVLCVTYVNSANGYPILTHAGETFLFEVTDAYGDGGGLLTFDVDVGHDTIVKSLVPKTITIPAGQSSVTKKVPLLVTNGDATAPPGGRAVAITSVNGCGAIGADFDPKTAGDQTTLMLGAGKSAKAIITLQLSKDDYISPNKKSPDRCTLSVCADSPPGPYGEGTPSNNCTSTDINILDENDF